MIDIFTDIFDYAAGQLEAQHSGIFVSSTYVPIPPRFPAVSIVEASNTVLDSMRTTTIENAASIMLECNVYTNTESLATSDARAIASTLDTALSSIGFTRTFMEPIENVLDPRIYRVTMRYEATVDRDLWIYQN